MKVHLSAVHSKQIEVAVRMEGDGVIGDYRQIVKPGEDFAGHSYAELEQLGPGEHDLDIDESED